MADAIGSQSLLSIYGVYEKLKSKDTAGAAAAAAAGASSSSNTTTGAGAASPKSQPAPAPSTATATPESESFKSQGNAAMARKDHAGAITLYTRALAIAPTNPIYLSNRAAAYSASHKHAEACADAEMAVAADPKYTKAWSRLGLARFVLGDARGSMEAYGKGIEYEGSGGSEAMKKGFKTAKDKVEELEREKEAGDLEEEVDGGSVAGGAAPGGGGGGMPDLSALAGMFGGGGGGGARGAGGAGGGGMPDLGSLMSNPMFANMAQNLMSNPETLQGLMNNPQLRGMAERFGLGGGGAGGGGGGGGMPDLSALAGMMGGAGRGGAGAGAGAGGGGGGGGMPDLASMMNDPNIAEM